VLRTRVITALVAASVASAAIFLLPLHWAAVFFGVLATLGAYEWAGLLGISSVINRLLAASIVVALMAVTWFVQPWLTYALVAGILAWLVATAVVIAYPSGAWFIGAPWRAGLLGVAILWAAWSALVLVHGEPGGNGAYWVFWVLFLVACADIGAYFAGRRFGKLKLAPLVSPGKTWEGVAGGALAALVICGGILLGLGYSALWLLYVLLLVGISVVGDLFESVLKRERGVKDSGNLLPGHGGILDRIDAALAVLPLFAVLFLR
tara:strand:- start:8696 stop:9487 length:792 start_codon:yes stop_codon:yes gene_type:complete